jgi:hypothetical protein
MAEPRSLLVTVAPSTLVNKVENKFGPLLRQCGELWVGDGLEDTEIQLCDNDVVITVTIRRRKKP